MHIWHFPMEPENRGPRPTALYPNPRNNEAHDNEARLYLNDNIFNSNTPYLCGQHCQPVVSACVALPPDQ